MTRTISLIIGIAVTALVVAVPTAFGEGRLAGSQGQDASRVLLCERARHPGIGPGGPGRQPARLARADAAASRAGRRAGRTRTRRSSRSRTSTRRSAPSASRTLPGYDVVLLSGDDHKPFQPVETSTPVASSDGNLDWPQVGIRVRHRNRADSRPDPGSEDDAAAPAPHTDTGHLTSARAAATADEAVAARPAILARCASPHARTGRACGGAGSTRVVRPLARLGLTGPANAPPHRSREDVRDGSGRRRSRSSPKATSAGSWPRTATGTGSRTHALRDGSSSRRGRRRERLIVEELAPADAVPVLREYYRRSRVTRPFFAVGLDSPDEAWLLEAPRHPAFRLRRP